MFYFVYMFFDFPPKISSLKASLEDVSTSNQTVQSETEELRLKNEANEKVVAKFENCFGEMRSQIEASFKQHGIKRSVALEHLEDKEQDQITVSVSARVLWLFYCSFFVHQLCV